MLHTPEVYTAVSYLAILHPTELQYILFQSYTAPCELHCILYAPLHPVRSTASCELHCTLWATLHNTELTCILLLKPFLAIPHPTELCWTLLWASSPWLSYPVPYLATIYPTKPHCTLLSYPTLSELCCTLLIYTVSTELRCTPLRYTVPYWAIKHSASYAALYWAMLHPTELSCILLSYPVPYWATLYPIKLHCTLLS